MKKPLFFLTTGTQFEFTRLVEAVNEWASKNQDIRVLAQIASSNSSFEHLEACEFLSPIEYAEVTSEAQVIIGHAGMGTVITGFENEKPLVLMARQFRFGEHRNDHQLSTVDKFKDVPGIYIVSDTKELFELLDSWPTLQKATENNSKNRQTLIDFLKNEINKG